MATPTCSERAVTPIGPSVSTRASSIANDVLVRLSENIEEMIRREEFEQMNSDGYLVNTARGGLVDTDALVDVISSGVSPARRSTNLKTS
ncbi:NAD(P)-dependent oxidoreductase [Halalkalicoccus sp. GCM10025322]|uniref:NAD(P)-dependent oxidoreductase n=1 Tax=Halalkalicoccus TaxID=332246 RepID=UPI002F962466